MEKGRDIVYEAIAARMSGLFDDDDPNLVDFSYFRNYTIEVSRDFYGQCSLEAKSVIDAWHAVGLLPEAGGYLGLFYPNIYMELEEVCQPVFNDPSATVVKDAFYKVTVPGEVNCVGNQTEVMPQANVIFKSANQIVLKPGFRAHSGSTFRAYIGPCLFNQYTKNTNIGTNQNSYNFVEEKINNSEITIYPNPSKGNINIDLSVELNDKAMLHLYNSMGQLIFEKEIELNNGHASLTLKERFLHQNLLLRLALSDNKVYQKIISME